MTEDDSFAEVYFQDRFTRQGMRGLTICSFDEGMSEFFIEIIEKPDWRVPMEVCG